MLAFAMRSLDSMAKPFWAIAILFFGTLGLSQWLATAEIKIDGAILASGMEPQVELIRKIASENGWKIECEGTSSRMTVLRIAPGILPWKASEDALWNELSAVATSLSSAARIASTTSCDLPADQFKLTWNDPDSPDSKVIFGVGPREELEPLLSIARACEIIGARLTDGPPAEQDVYLGEVPSDWVGLEIDPKLNLEAGPAECLILLGNREFYSQDPPK